MVASKPRLWIIAGPNGCGKSTAYSRSEISELDGSVWIINPDELTLRIHETEGLNLPDANLEAVNRIEAWLESSIQVHQTIGVETVLSTPKYRRLVERAKGLGFEIRLIYVIVESAELQIERVRLRVKKGGHHVPDDKVRTRRTRSLEQLRWFFDQSDYCLIYDNSTSTPKMMVELQGDIIRINREASDDILRAIDIWPAD